MKGLITAAALALALTSPAVLPAQAATVIGVPVFSPASSDQVGSVNSNPGDAIPDGTVGFFIPLTSGKSTTYGSGINGGGLVSDTCSTLCSGGELTMFLRYDTQVLGTHLLTFDFTDLDLVSANDPVGFFESMELFAPHSGLPLGKITSITDPGVSGGSDYQRFQTQVNVTSDEFIAKLVLRVEPNSLVNMRNTEEFLYTTMEASPTAVPGPIAGAGLPALLALGGLIWARRRKTAAAA